MIKIVLLILLLQPAAFASKAKPFQVVQIGSQISLTERILQDKIFNLEIKKQHLAEVSSSIALIRGFKDETKAMRLAKQKRDLLTDLNQIEAEIVYLNVNRQKLIEKKNLLSRQVSLAR